MNRCFRVALLEDLPFLEEMLFNAVFWPVDRPRPATVAEGLAPPELAHILAGWSRGGDTALIVAVDGRPAGAAWYRYWSDCDSSYGYIAAGIPVLGIALKETYRGQGLGRELLTRLMEIARAAGAARISLSVEKENPSRFLYISCGFVMDHEDDEDYIMVKELYPLI